MITSKEIGWIAGFLEGEGCFEARRQSNGGKGLYLRVTAVQVQREPLERLLRYCGGTIRPRGKQHPTWQLSYVWRVNSLRAVGLMMMVYPIMSPVRQKKITECLGAWKITPVIKSYQFRRRTCLKGHSIEPNASQGSRCQICKREHNAEYQRTHMEQHYAAMRRYTERKRLRLGISKGSGSTMHGESHSMAKLKRVQVDEIRRRARSSRGDVNGEKHTTLAAEFGVTVSTIGMIVRNRIWAGGN